MSYQQNQKFSKDVKNSAYSKYITMSILWKLSSSLFVPSQLGDNSDSDDSPMSY